MDLISSMAEIEENDPHRMFTIIAHRLKINLAMQEEMVKRYGGLLAE